MSKDQDQQQDQKNIDPVLSSEANALTKIQSDIGELLEANQQLDSSRQLKKEVDALKKEAPSLPWFKRLVQIIPQVKYLFIKNDEQIAAEKRKANRELLIRVDNTLKRIGEKSSPLQVIIDKELQAGLAKIIEKNITYEQLERVKKLQLSLSNLDVSQEDFRKIVPKVYNANEAVELLQERTQLTQIQKDINKLVDANSRVQGLLAIKKELAELRQELPSTWLESLKQVVAKIKHAFVSTPEEILKDSITKNNATLERVDKALEITGKNIAESTLARKNKLHKELENLGKRGLSEDQSKQLEDLRSKFESTFAKAVVASEPLLTMIGQEQVQPQALYSSMPNLQTTQLRPAPLPPPLNTSLPNLAVQQPNVAAAIPPAPPLPPGGLQGTQQTTTGSMPARPTREAPPPPIRTTSLPDINVQQLAENAKPASISSQPKRHAPLPPTRTTSLPDINVQQPDVAAAVVPPPPPPPPPHVVPGLQQGAHQVEGQVMPPPLAADLTIPPPLPPPPPLPAGGFNPPPPPPLPPTQPKNPAAALIEQPENRGQLLDETAAGVMLKKAEIVDKLLASGVDGLLNEIKGGRVLTKVPENWKEGRAEIKAPTKQLDLNDALRRAVEVRNRAFHGDDEDNEHEHADLLELIKSDKLDKDTLTSLQKEGGVKSKKELIEFIKKDLSPEWDEVLEFNKQKAIIDKLETIKAEYDKYPLTLSAKPVPVVDAQKVELSKDAMVEVQAIRQNLQNLDKVAEQTNKPPPPPPPPPPKIQPVRGQGV